MFTAVSALLVRILSNPAANLLQKIEAGKYSSILVNLYSFFFLSLFCIYPSFGHNWEGYSVSFWCYVAMAGILCTLGSVCLIKALKIGEMSVLGPINSYKCIVGLVIGYLLLGEVPSFAGFLGVIFIIFGSRFIFDTVEKGAGLRVLLRKDIILRFMALFFTGCEAVILKKIILISSPQVCFILWCFTGFIFSLLLILLFRVKFEFIKKSDFINCLGIALCLGLMQMSTNFVFERLNVGLSLALFQLSGVIAVIFGYKVFGETDFMRKLGGSIIMIIGSCMILLS